MDNCNNGIGLGCNGFPGTLGSGGFSSPNTTNSPGVTPDLVNPENNPPTGSPFLANLPDLLGSLTGGFADVYGAIQGIPQAPDNVTYVTYAAPDKKEEKSNPARFIWIMLAVLAAIGLVVWAISRTKK